MKQIAVNTIKAFLKEHKHEDTYTQTFEVADSSFEVVFHTNLSIAEKTTFINRVLSGCFDGMGNFRPEYVTPLLRATILQMCTNIPALALKNEASDSGAPALDLEAMNELYLAMELDNKKDHDYRMMLDCMSKLCWQAIEWKKEQLAYKSEVSSALRELLNTVTKKVDEVDVSGLMQYASELSKVTEGLEKGELADKLIELSQYRNETDI